MRQRTTTLNELYVPSCTPYNTMPLMTFDEVNTRIDQPMEHVISKKASD